jgi:O-antigen/teichoic acid export membrane protein
VLDQPDRLNELANHQTQISLLLAGPLFALLLGAAPLVLQLLYSSQFVAAAPTLRWQVLGEFVRLLASPLAYVLLAAGRSKLLLIVDTLTAGTFVGLTALLLPVFGLEGAGLAYLGSTIVFAVTAASLARWRHRLRWSPATTGIAVLGFGGAVVTTLAGEQSLVGGLIAGLLTSAILTLLAIRHLAYLLPAPIRDLPLVRHIAGAAPQPS